MRRGLAVRLECFSKNAQVKLSANGGNGTGKKLRFETNKNVHF